MREKEHRRGFLLCAVALLAAPLASLAQPPQQARRIGFLSPDSSDSSSGRQARKMFSGSLRQLGYKEGNNLVIEWRWADGKAERLSPLAKELVRLRVEVIVARTNDPIAAAREA